MILSRRAALAGIAALALATPAFAHHGWSWTESGFFQIEGIVTDFYFGNPIPRSTSTSRARSGASSSRRPRPRRPPGFSESTIVVGDEITAIGNRSQDESETRMKAVRVIVKGQTYDVYPDRAKDI